MGMCNVQYALTHEWPGQYLDVPGVRVEEGAVALPAQGPAHPVPWGVTCSLSLGVLEWTGPPQAGRLELILLGPWGIDLIPCLLSLRGRLWITPRELQLHSLHWTSCLLRGVIAPNYPQLPGLHGSQFSLAFFWFLSVTSWLAYLPSRDEISAYLAPPWLLPPPSSQLTANIH